MVGVDRGHRRLRDAGFSDASALDWFELLTLFNEAFSDYVVPVRLDSTALQEHVSFFDIDLSASPVWVDPSPKTFALMAIRDQEAWVGGMGTVPAFRKRGYGEATLVAGLEAVADRGCTTARLEVIDINEPALRLYERLGFTSVREVKVWSLSVETRSVDATEAIPVADAQAWIARNRLSREPWQRADPTLARMKAHGQQLCARAVMDAGSPVAAAVYRARAGVAQVLQFAAVDDAAAAMLLLATAAEGKGLRFGNVPSGELAENALTALNASLVVRQIEMCMDLPRGDGLR